MVYKKTIITHLAPYRENNCLMNAMCNFKSSPWGVDDGQVQYLPAAQAVLER